MQRDLKSHLSHRKNERGSVLAYTVLSVLFLFLAVGLGADLSHLYLVKTELQNAADSAALAGASALLLPQPERIPRAVERAVETLNKNKYNFNNLNYDGLMTKEQMSDPAAGIVKFAVNLDGPYLTANQAQNNPFIRFVKVDTPTAGVDIFFSIPVLGLEREMTATATAGLSRPINVFCNFIPISVVEGAFGEGIGWMDFNGDGVKDQSDCSPPPAPPPAPGASPTPSCDPRIKFCAGCKYKMVAGPGDWHDTSPGNYQALDAGSGAKDLKLAIAGGSSMCLKINDDATFITETEPGRMTGPILKGLNTRFDDYAGFGGGGSVTVGGVSMSIEEAFPPDVNIFDNAPKNKNVPYPGINYVDYAAAFASKSGPFWEPPSPADSGVPQRREITMPIINESEFDPGKDIVKFTRFGKFFLNRKVGGIPSNPEIYVEYMEPAGGAGGLDPGGGPTAPIVVPVLYR